jgi:hypothetical protein
MADCLHRSRQYLLCVMFGLSRKLACGRERSPGVLDRRDVPGAGDPQGELSKSCFFACEGESGVRRRGAVDFNHDSRHVLEVLAEAGSRTVWEWACRLVRPGTASAASTPASSTVTQMEKVIV